MYTYAHPIEDALESITHSICTLEFEDQRPFYDWLLERLAELGLSRTSPLPQQIEFARLNLTYVVLSKRKLIQLVEEKHVDGWDDPRMPTLVGARRRGYTPEGFRLFAERIGVSKADSWIDYSVLEDCMREHLNESRRAAIAVLDPLKLVIDNYPEGTGGRPRRPTIRRSPNGASAAAVLARALDRARGLHGNAVQGLFPPLSRQQGAAALRLRGRVHRLRQGCDGNLIAVHCNYCPDSKSGTPGADTYKVKGNIHWVCAKHAYQARCASTTACSRCRTRARRAQLPRRHQPGGEAGHHRLSRTLAQEAQPEERFQFERHGYFVADSEDSAPGAPVFNRAVTLRDSWAKESHGGQR